MAIWEGAVEVQEEEVEVEEEVAEEEAEAEEEATASTTTIETGTGATTTTVMGGNILAPLRPHQSTGTIRGQGEATAVEPVMMVKYIAK